MSKPCDLTCGTIWKPLLYFALPLLASSLVQQMYNMVDLFFVGNVLGKSASAAVGSSGMLVTCLVGFFTGMSVGCGVVVAQRYGAKDPQGLHKAVHTAVALSLLGGAVLTVLGLCLAPQFLGWLGTPAHLSDMALEYVRIYLLSLLSLIFYNIGSGILRAAGNSRLPMYFLLVGSSANVLFDWLFIMVFGWGVAGVAWATAVSQTLSAALVVASLMRTKAAYQLQIRKIRIETKVLLQIIRIGLPAGIQAMVLTFSNIVVQCFINGLGENEMAAFSVYFRIENFMYLPIMAFGQAMTTFAGQNVGAGKYERVKRGTWVCLGMSVGVTIVISGILLLTGQYLFGIFTPDMQVVEHSWQILLVTAPFYFFYSFIETPAGTIRGTGSSLIPMLTVMVCLCGIRMGLLALWMPVWQGVTGLAAVYPVTWILAALSLMGYYWSGRWIPKKERFLQSRGWKRQARRKEHRYAEDI